LSKNEIALDANLLKHRMFFLRKTKMQKKPKKLLFTAEFEA